MGFKVTTRSPLGAVAYETGGILVQHGWLRVVGSGHARLPRDLLGWNRNNRPPEIPPGFLLVADDVLGGIFAVNGGGLVGELGAVSYFAPDRLEWEHASPGYSDFISWVVDGDVSTFYRDSRWLDRESEVRNLFGDQTFSFYPPLWAAGPKVGDRSRRPVPTSEAIGLQFDLRAQLGPADATD